MVDPGLFALWLFAGPKMDLSRISKCPRRPKKFFLSIFHCIFMFNKCHVWQYFQNLFKKRMHSSMMHTARSSNHREGGSGTSHPQEQTPPEQTSRDQVSPGTRHPPQDQVSPQDQAPPGTRHLPPEADPPCGQNDRQVEKYYLAPNFVCGR